MATPPRYRTFLPSVSKLVPKGVHIEYKQFKRGTGSYTKPEVCDPDRVPLPDSSPDADRDSDSPDGNEHKNADNPDDKSDEEEIEIEDKASKTEKEESKKGVGVNDNFEQVSVVAAADQSFDAIVSRKQLEAVQELDGEGVVTSTTGATWQIPEDDSRDLLELQMWRREFGLTIIEIPMIQSIADKIRDFVVEYLKDHSTIEKVQGMEWDILWDQLPVDFSQLLKYETQNLRREKKKVYFEALGQSLKEYMLTAISYRARKLRRGSIVTMDKVKVQETVPLGLIDEVADAVDRRYDRLYKQTSQPGLEVSEVDGVQLAVSEVKRRLRRTLQTKVSVDHQALGSEELERHFEEIDRLAKDLIKTVIGDTQPQHRTTNLLLECTYELVDIIVKKLTPVSGKSSDEIIEDLVTHSRHILTQELNKRGITV